MVPQRWTLDILLRKGNSFALGSTGWFGASTTNFALTSPEISLQWAMLKRETISIRKQKNQTCNN